MPVESALPLALQIAEALEAAHNKGSRSFVPLLTLSFEYIPEVTSLGGTSIQSRVSQEVRTGRPELERGQRAVEEVW